MKSRTLCFFVMVCLIPLCLGCEKGEGIEAELLSGNPAVVESEEPVQEIPSEEVEPVSERVDEYVIMTLPLSVENQWELLLDLENRYETVEKVGVDHDFVQLKIVGFGSLEEAEFEMYRLGNIYPEMKKGFFVLREDEIIVDDSESFSYRDDSTVGLKDVEGKVLFSTNFLEFEPFSEGIGCVKVDFDRWMFIKRDGVVLSGESYQMISAFGNGLAPVKREGRWGYIDASGEVAIPFDYVDARSFHEGLAAVQVETNGSDLLWGFIDPEGRLAITPVYVSAFDFSEGLAAVMIDGKGYGYIDPSGDFQVNPRYATAMPFENAMAEVYGINQQYLIDTSGQIIQHRFDTYDRQPMPEREGEVLDERALLFIAELKKRIEDRDLDYLMGIVSEDIKTGYESRGSESFTSMWNLEKEPLESALWEELALLVDLGFHNDENRLLTAPYDYHQDSGALDFGYGYVIMEGTPIFSAPVDSSECLDDYSRELIAFMHNFEYVDEGGERWNTVVLSDGRIGYVSSQKVRKKTDYRVSFSYSESKDDWEMISLMSGE